MSEGFSPHPDKRTIDGWLKRENDWIDALESKIGEPLAFFHIDITNWQIPVSAYIPKLSSLLRNRHIPVGIYDIASDSNGPDDAWARSVTANIRTLRALEMPEPDHILICTWFNYPRQNLPETSPTSLTHLVNWYFDERDGKNRH